MKRNTFISYHYLPVKEAGKEYKEDTCQERYFSILRILILGSITFISFLFTFPKFFFCSVFWQIYETYRDSYFRHLDKR